jgi:ferrous iron transport protein B
MIAVDFKYKKLSEIPIDQEVVIAKVKGSGAFRKRLLEMGFVKGKSVKVIKNAPLMDPIEYEIMGYSVSLRRSEADLIDVIDIDDIKHTDEVIFNGTIDENRLKTTIRKATNKINVALVGNPNSGKTTLFNFASGAHERVGNYGGVTVDVKEGIVNYKDYTINLFDLPGTYSITEYSPEELYVRRHIIENQPDIIINVIDASNLERNLYLTTQLIDMNVKVVIALNMFDELEKSGAILDYKHLAEMLGIPIIPTVASKGIGIPELIEKIIDVYEDKDPIVRHIHINYGENIESSIKRIQKAIKEFTELKYKFSTRYLAIKLLENDRETRRLISETSKTQDVLQIVDEEIKKIESLYKEKSETVITDLKYGFVSGALAQTYKPGKINFRKITRQIDKIVTNKYLGFPIFFLFLYITFEATFFVGGYPAEWIEFGIEAIKNIFSNYVPNGPFKDLIIEGIIGGVGNVLVFLPNILVLFFFISFLEDVGYMARAAFIVDKIMHKIGLHGKSFIPIIMGFGCNVPAIMATRTLVNKKDRILTMLIIPFMSCSARLPVYLLFISAFFDKNQGLVLTSIYFLGLIMAAFFSIIFNKLFFKGQDVPFVMELPPYRMPTLKSSIRHMWYKASAYLKKMGTIILGLSIIIWYLSSYPKNENIEKFYDEKIEQIHNVTNLDENTKNEKIDELNRIKVAEIQANSYIGKMGKAIEPIIAPLGFDWKIGVAIISGLSAKEVIISTLSIIYKANDEGISLKDNLKKEKFLYGPNKGEPVFTPLTVYTLLVFVLIYFPCIATIAAIKNESNWKWALFAIFYTTSVAYITAFLVNNIVKLFL